MIIAGHDWVRKIRSIILNRIFFIIFLLPYLFFSFVTYKDFGITLDEPIEYNFGQMLYARNFGRDPLLMRDFAVAGDDSREIWAYNHFHTMLLYIVNGSGSIEIYHLLNLLFGILGFYLAFELVFLVSHNPVLSLLGPVFLFFTPRFLGDLPGNVKDPVFAIYYLLALTATAFIPKYKSSILRVVCVGITIGLSAAMRVLGYGLIPIYGLFLFKHLINQKTSLQFIYKSLFIELTAITLMAIIVHAIEMPFVASNPLLNLPQLFKLGVAYPWDGEMLYLGKIIHTGSIPWHYIFVWAGITTPIFLLCTWFLSHLIWKLKEVQLFNFAIWFNILVYFIIKPNIYDAIRHLQFLLVVISIVVAMVWAHLWKVGKNIHKVVLSVILFVFIVNISMQYITLHPYQYTYFNGIVGGLVGAQNNFETDYWGASYKEAVLWLVANKRNEDASVGICGNQPAITYFSTTNFNPIWMPNCEQDENTNTRYVITNNRNAEWERVRGQEIFAVTRFGVPLTKVFETN